MARLQHIVLKGKPFGRAQVRDVMDRINEDAITVTFDASRWRIRVRLASVLIRLAAWILGMRYGTESA